MPYYAVVKGREPGFYDNWENFNDQVYQFSGCKFRKFNCKERAKRYLYEHDIYLDRSSEDSTSYDDSCESCEFCNEVREDENGFVDVYVEGICYGNGLINDDAQAGVGVFFSDGHYRNVSTSMDGLQAHNKAQITAVTFAAREAAKAGIEKLRINTKSGFVRDCEKKLIKIWKSRDWKTLEGDFVIERWALLKMEKAFQKLEDCKLVYHEWDSEIYGFQMANKFARDGALDDD